MPHKKPLMDDEMAKQFKEMCRRSKAGKLSLQEQKLCFSIWARYDFDQCSQLQKEGSQQAVNDLLAPWQAMSS